jgi:Cu(I)/Ag(I) efflux system protein CusF
MQIRKKGLMLSLLAAAAFSIPALAQQSDHASHHGAAQIAQAAALTEGEVRKVDKDAQKITIKHGPLQNLDMPAMTMVFQVKDPGMLEQVKAGDKVNFQAEKIGGAFTVTKIEPVK